MQGLENVASFNQPWFIMFRLAGSFCIRTHVGTYTPCIDAKFWRRDSFRGGKLGGGKGDRGLAVEGWEGWEKCRMGSRWELYM